jgi:release factor glutamine methyltransferase
VKISFALAQAAKELDSKGVSNSKLDSLILLSYALSFSKEQIIFNPDFEINLSQQEKFFDLVARRLKREPISHIIGKREFFAADFLVNKDVLDPRPDSESLIELTLKIFSDKNKSIQIEDSEPRPRNKCGVTALVDRIQDCHPALVAGSSDLNQKLKILELGVGSGCLIITLLKAFQMADGIGVDVSKKALEICDQNAIKHQIKNRLQLLESDLFSAVNSQEKFDLIISNPPYIASDEIENLQSEVRIYEPRLALDGGVDGFDFYRKIAANAKNFLKENAKIILEIGFGQEKEVKKIFTSAGFYFIESKCDLSGIVRVLCFKALFEKEGGSIAKAIETGDFLK